MQRFLKKLKIELSSDPEISLLGIYPEENMVQKDKCTPMFIAVLFTIAKTWEQLKYSWMDEWIHKMGSIHTVNITQTLRRMK